MNVTTIQERLKQLMRERGLRQVDILRLTRPICEECGVRLEKSDLSQYVSGKVQPSREKLQVLSRALGVSEAWLIGYDYPQTAEASPTVPQAEPETKTRGIAIPGVMPVGVKRVPMLGDIACGEPLFASEERDDWRTVGADLDADFCLTARGDSMVGARILDGDLVFIKAMDMVENGEIAAVLIGEEATLKRVYYYPDQNKLILTPENPRYERLIYLNEELDSIRILGRAVAFRSEIR